MPLEKEVDPIFVQRLHPSPPVLALPSGSPHPNQELSTPWPGLLIRGNQGFELGFSHCVHTFLPQPAWSQSQSRAQTGSWQNVLEMSGATVTQKAKKRHIPGHPFAVSTTT